MFVIYSLFWNKIFCLVFTKVFSTYNTISWKEIISNKQIYVMQSLSWMHPHVLWGITVFQLNNKSNMQKLMNPDDKWTRISTLKSPMNFSRLSNVLTSSSRAFLTCTGWPISPGSEWPLLLVLDLISIKVYDTDRK